MLLLSALLQLRCCLCYVSSAGNCMKAFDTCLLAAGRYTCALCIATQVCHGDLNSTCQAAADSCSLYNSACQWG
jgi:hypothetical protein